MSDCRIVPMNYTDAGHVDGLTALVDEYARDPDELGRSLDDAVRERVVGVLREHPATLVLLAFEEDGGAGTPVGAAVCVWSVSTFAGRWVLNVHDLIVTEAWRGRGVGAALLGEAERLARQAGCAAITLEVRANNPARRLYARLGYDGALHEAADGATLFCKKPLT